MVIGCPATADPDKTGAVTFSGWKNCVAPALTTKTHATATPAIAVATKRPRRARGSAVGHGEGTVVCTAGSPIWAGRRIVSGQAAEVRKPQCQAINGLPHV